jgi:DNA repair ATPase RecN
MVFGVFVILKRDFIMTVDYDKELLSLSGELTKMHSELLGITGSLNGFVDRIDTIVKQIKRKIEVRDTKVDHDFKELSHRVKDFYDNLYDFWKKAQNILRAIQRSKKLQTAGNIRMRGLGSQSRALNSHIEEFNSVFRYVRAQGKNLPNRLNWFMFETYCKDLSKVSGKILFVTTQLTKVLEFDLSQSVMNPETKSDFDN